MYSSFNARAVGLSLSSSETIDLAALAGFDAVDLLVRDLLAADDRPDRLRRRMDDLGLKGGAFPLPLDWRADEATFRTGLGELPRYAEAAATLGLTGTGTWVCPEIPLFLDGSDGFARTVAFHLDRLGPIAETLTRFGLSLALEVIGPERSRTRQTPRFITRLGELRPITVPLARSFKIGLLLDSFHLYADGESVDAAIGGSPVLPTWVHLADLPAGSSPDRSQIVDAVRGLPGDQGAIDNRTVLRRLHEIGYDGPVTIEPLSKCSSLVGLDPQATAFAVSRAMKSVWPV